MNVILSLVHSPVRDSYRGPAVNFYLDLKSIRLLFTSFSYLQYLRLSVETGPQKLLTFDLRSRKSKRSETFQLNRSHNKLLWCGNFSLNFLEAFSCLYLTEYTDSL